jgi:hypothetical protein
MVDLANDSRPIDTITLPEELDRPSKLEAIGLDDSDGRTFAEQIAAVLIKHALRGDVRAIQEPADRTEGSPRQQFNIDASADVLRRQPSLRLLPVY